MKEDRYWNFSKSERYAAVIFAAATIATLLYTYMPVTGNNDAITEQYKEEIKMFEEKISKRDTVKKFTPHKKKTKTTKTNNTTEQYLVPKTRENRN